MFKKGPFVIEFFVIARTHIQIFLDPSNFRTT